MVVMKKYLNNRFVRAALSGLKPCIIGIILATGMFMILKNCGLVAGGKTDFLTIGLTCIISLIYFGSGKFVKKRLSPIMLICLSALVGVVAYGV